MSQWVSALGLLSFKPLVNGQFRCYDLSGLPVHKAMPYVSIGNATFLLASHSCQSVLLLQLSPSLPSQAMYTALSKRFSLASAIMSYVRHVDPTKSIISINYTSVCTMSLANAVGNIYVAQFHTSIF